MDYRLFLADRPLCWAYIYSWIVKGLETHNHDLPNPAFPDETAGPLPIPCHGKGKWQKCAAFCQTNWIILSSYVKFRWTMKWII